MVAPKNSRILLTILRFKWDSLLTSKINLREKCNKDAITITFCKLVFQFSEYLLERLMKSTWIRYSTLRVVSTTFSLVGFTNLKGSTYRRKKGFFFHFESFFFSWDNQIAFQITFPVFKCHDVIKCLSMRHEIHPIEQLGK